MQKQKINISNYNFKKNIFIKTIEDKEKLVLLFQGINKIKHIEKLFNSNCPSRTIFYQNIKNLRQWITNKTQFLDQLIKQKFEISFKTRCYWLIKGNKNLEFCKNPDCNKNLVILSNVQNIISGYHNYCSVKCINNDPKIKEKIKNTNEKLYGNKNYNNREQAQKTTELHYGVKNPFQSREIKEKIIKTHQQKLNVDYPMQNKEIHAKSIKTLKEKFGVEYPLQASSILTKYKQTIQKKYGCLNVLQVPKIRNSSQYKYTYKNIQFDSSNEIAFYIYLVDNNIKFEYQPNKSFKYKFKNIVHFYIPDFYLIKQKKYIEIKGPHFFYKNGTMCNPYCPKNNPKRENEDLLAEAKHQCMLKNNVKIIRTDSLEMQKIMNYIAEKYGKDYLKQFRNK